MKSVLIALGIVAGAVAVLLVIGAVDYKPETGAVAAARMRAACEKEYGSDGEMAVNECFIKEAGKYMDQREQDRQSRVDESVHP